MLNVFINGKGARLLIDSGATSSYLDITQSKHYRFTVEKSEDDVAGIGGTRDIYDIYNVTLLLRGGVLKHKFKGMDLSSVTSRKHIVGILGTDFLNKHEVMINYKDKFLTYKIL